MRLSRETTYLSAKAPQRDPWEEEKAGDDISNVCDTMGRPFLHQ